MKGSMRYLVFFSVCLLCAASAVSGATVVRPNNPPPVAAGIGGQVGELLNRLSALTIMDNQVYGAGSGQLALIGDDGVPKPGVAISRAAGRFAVPRSWACLLLTNPRRRTYTVSENPR